MTTPLILKGTVEVWDSNLATPTWVDISDVVRTVKISSSTETVDIPATFGADKSTRAGATSYSAELSYFQDVSASTTLTRILWASQTSTDKTVQFRAMMEEGAISSTNPRWTFTAIITSVDIGGEAETLATSSATFPLTAAPSMATS